MATPAAILEVSNALRSLIAAGVPIIANPQIVLESIDLLPDPVPKPRITIFLYNISENPELKNRPHEVVSVGVGTATLTPPPAVVELDYLICAWTTTTADEHLLLGHIIRTVYDTPELTASTLGPGWLPDEHVQLSMATPPIEDQARIWTNFGFKRFKLSLYYKASVVPIRSQREFTDGVVGERRADLETLAREDQDLVPAEEL